MKYNSISKGLQVKMHDNQQVCHGIKFKEYNDLKTVLNAEMMNMLITYKLIKCKKIEVQRCIIIYYNALL